MDNKIIVIDDDEGMCKLINDFLKRKDFEVKWFNKSKDALRDIKENNYTAAVIDINMPDINGIKLCEILSAEKSEIPVIMITAFGNMDTAISALRAGAYDFITKPLDLNFLLFSIKRAVNHYNLQEKIKILNNELSQFKQFDDIIGESTVMKKLYQQIEKTAHSDASILITGESGTGKELVAKALHKYSFRKDKPFIAVNCSAIPANLFESELFGFKKGAFTDAKDDFKGLIHQVNGGTLFLDEIGDFPIELQPKLLRALEEKKIRPIGSESEVSFDARIISATNQNIEALITKQLFREDLYYRLNVINLHLPSLRERGNDILLLADYYLNYFTKTYDKKITGFQANVIKRFLEYQWPGNIRELRNAIERSVALTAFDKITLSDLPDKIKNIDNNSLYLAINDSNENLTLEEIEKKHIIFILDSVKNNLTKAAKILGINRTTLYRKMDHYNISVK